MYLIVNIIVFKYTKTFVPKIGKKGHHSKNYIGYDDVFFYYLFIEFILHIHNPQSQYHNTGKGKYGNI